MTRISPGSRSRVAPHTPFVPPFSHTLVRGARLDSAHVFRPWRESDARVSGSLGGRTTGDGGDEPPRSHPAGFVRAAAVPEVRRGRAGRPSRRRRPSRVPRLRGLQVVHERWAGRAGPDSRTPRLADRRQGLTVVRPKEGSPPRVAREWTAHPEMSGRLRDSGASARLNGNEPNRPLGASVRPKPALLRRLP